MTMGRNAVGYLTESMHGAGSPQAQRIQIQRLMQIEYKKRLARVLAGLDVDEERKDDLANELGQYFERVFKVEPN
jgi:Aromatic ring hydroxylase